jgi:hypothetical protein
MRDSTNAIATLSGAIVGAIVGFLFFTDDGRTVRRRIERSLETANRELSNFRQTLAEAAAVADDGRQLLNDVMSDAAHQPKRYPTARQTSPF